MRHTLLGDAAVGLSAGRCSIRVLAVATVLSGHSMALATTWTISGASAGGASQSVTSLAGGSVGINVDASGFTSSTVADPAGVRTALWGAVGGFSGPLPPGNLGFFGFTDTGGSGATYFGFAWFSNPFASAETLTFTSSNSAQQGILTNISGATSSGGSLTPTPDVGTPENNFYYYLFANVAPSSTISISGTVANQAVKWLDWSGSSWTSLPGSSGVSTGSSGAFALGSAVAASAVPGGAAGLAGGLAAMLFRRRRQRANA
jgi:hypothetical protein